MHPTEQAFITAIHDNPRDDAPRLIFADWLEERGDPYGEFIRLQSLEPQVAVLIDTGKPIAQPDTPKGRRLLELFPAIIGAERFAFWHRIVERPVFVRGLCHLYLRDETALHYDPPPLVRLSIKTCGRMLEKLLPLPIMTRVDHITMSIPRIFDPWDGYENMLTAFMEWPGLKNLEGVTMCGGPPEAVERLSQQVPVRWVR